MSDPCFSIKTLKLGLYRLLDERTAVKLIEEEPDKEKSNQVILIEKEFSLASVKLIQAFQIIKTFLSQHEKPKTLTLFDFLMSFLKPSDGKNKHEDIQKQKLRNHIKSFERHVRILELTYIDLYRQLNQLQQGIKTPVQITSPNSESVDLFMVTQSGNVRDS